MKTEKQGLQYSLLIISLQKAHKQMWWYLAVPLTPALTTISVTIHVRVCLHLYMTKKDIKSQGKDFAPSNNLEDYS